MRLLALFIALATALQAAVPLKDPRITGTNSQVASGTFAIKSGATLAVEAGAFFTLAASLPLSMGGTGAPLADPGADRLLFWDDSAGAVDWLTLGTGLSTTGTTLNISAAPVSATYITQTADTALTNEQALSGLATGLLQVTTSTGVLSSVTTSAGIAGLLGDETGSGALVFGTSPTIATPTISGAITLPAGVRQTFAPDATTPGINVGSVAGDPSTPSNGDLWYNSTDNQLTARINGASVDLGAGGGGSVATDTLWDAKGDLAVGTGADTASRLAVGSNGQVLTADSAEATGVKWASVSGTGDVVGPASSTDARLALFDSTTGKLLKQSTALTESGGTITSNTAIGLTAGGTNQNITLTPSGTGAVRAVNRLYVGEGSAAFGGYQSLILAREGSSYGGALGIHHGANPTDNFAWTFQRGRGTLASPSAVQSGDRLGQFTFAGYNGSAYGNSAAIYADTTENWSGSAQGASLYFATTANGTTTRTNRMIIEHDGRTIVGDTTANSTTANRALNLTGSTAVMSVIRTGSLSAAVELKSRSTINAASDIAYWDFYVNSNSSSLDDFTLRRRTASADQIIFTAAPNKFTVPSGVVTELNGGWRVGTASSTAATGPAVVYGTDTASSTLSIRRADATTGSGAVYFSKSGGSMGSPSVPSSGDRLGAIAAGGWNGSAWSDTQALFGFSASETWGASAMGTQFVVGLTPNGSTTRQDRLTLDHDGKLYLGTNTAGYLSGASGGLALTAQGTNQSIAVTPSGTGAALAISSSSPRISYAPSASNFVNHLNVQPASGNFDGRIIIAPSGTNTETAVMLQSNPSVDTTNSEFFAFGGGFSGAVAGAWNLGSMVYANASANSRPISFSVSNTTDSRIEAMRILNTGKVDVKRGLTISGGDITADKTITAGGTTGAQTINKNAGSVNFAASASSLVVTNSRVTANSVIIATVATNDSTMKSVAVVAGAGSFTIHANAAATAETRVNFFIVN